MIESKTQTIYKLFQLVLNPVSGRFEDGNLVALGSSPEEVFNWMKEEVAEESYEEHGYRKTFKKGSKLEFYNPLERETVEDCLHRPGGYHGISETWITKEDLVAFIKMCEGSFGFKVVPELVGEVQEFYNEALNEV